MRRAVTWLVDVVALAIAFVLFVLVALCFLGGSAAAQTYPRDVTGTPAPNCVYQDSLGIFQLCGPSFPLPVSSAGLTPDPLLDSYGFGRFWFQATTSPFIATQAVSGFFVDDSTVVAIQKPFSGGCIQQFRSIDGGRTYATTGLCQVVAGVSLGGGKTAAQLTNGNLLVAGNVTATDPGILFSTSGQFFAVSTITPSLAIGGNVTGFGQQGGTVIATVDDNDAGPTFRACRSTNNGSSWSCVAVKGALGTQSQSSGGSVVSPAPSTWIIGMVNGGNLQLFRSTDDGITWTSVFNAAPAAVFSARPGGGCFTTTVCVFAVGGLIVRSSDAGVTWSRVFDSPTDEQLINFIVYNGTTGEALSWAGTGAHYRTTNGGNTWSAVPNVGCGTGGPNGASTAQARKGRAVFFTPATSCAFFSPSLGQNPNPIVNNKGEAGMFQGTATTGPNAWPTSIMQSGTIQNVQQTSAANSAQTITLTGLAATRITVRALVCFLSAAGSATLTIQDGVGFTLNLGTFNNPAAAPFFPPLGASGMTLNTGNSASIVVGAAGAGVTSTCNVLADRI